MQESPTVAATLSVAGSAQQTFGDWPVPSFVTIDGESTRDLDDGICVQAREGRYLVSLVIADPTAMVPVESSDDVNARNLGATIYVRDKPIHRMLRPAISERESSLVAGQERSAFRIDVELDDRLNTLRTALSMTKVTIAHRLSYDDIPHILSDGDHELNTSMTVACGLARALLAKRRQSGALALYDLSRFIFSDEEGRLIQLARKDEVIGNILVQEMMILGNSSVADYAIERDIPMIFRNHQAKSSAPPVAELAQTVDSWLQSGNLDTEEARTKFMAVLGRANYSAFVRGHYALAKPAYTHITSPLRRYADLFNLHQIKAHLAGNGTPRDRDQTEAIALALNETIERRKEERSEGFKNALRRVASEAVEKGVLSRLADHELVQALKFGVSAGALPETLVSEIADRLERETATDKLLDHLFTQVPVGIIPECLRAAFFAWIEGTPARAMHLVMHAQQTELFTIQILAVAQGSCFSATATLAAVDGQAWVGQGVAARKKEAEQAAAVSAIAKRLEIDRAPLEPHTPDAVHTSPQATMSSGNPKGALLEICQKKALPGPTFTGSSSGPSHAMRFACEVTLTIDGRALRASVSDCGSKKDAEARASAEMLAQIGQASPAPAKAMAQVVADLSNPVGHLQELAQMLKKPMPLYEVHVVRDQPPLFEAKVTTYHSGERSEVGRGNTKQDAKKAAAALACKAA